MRQIGIAESELDKAAEIAAEGSFRNPEPVTVKRIRALLQNAFDGLPPRPA